MLLDTHVMLWWLQDSARLESQIRHVIQEPDNAIFVSIVSVWECAVKVRVGKLDVDLDDVLSAVNAAGFELLGLFPSHLKNLMNLPLHHHDPFDHLLMAQALTEELIFVSEDRRIRAYGLPLMSCSNS